MVLKVLFSRGFWPPLFWPYRIAQQRIGVILGGSVTNADTVMHSTPEMRYASCASNIMLAQVDCHEHHKAFHHPIGVAGAQEAFCVREPHRPLLVLQVAARFDGQRTV